MINYGTIILNSRLFPLLLPPAKNLSPRNDKSPKKKELPETSPIPS